MEPATAFTLAQLLYGGLRAGLNRYAQSRSGRIQRAERPQYTQTIPSTSSFGATGTGTSSVYSRTSMDEPDMVPPPPPIVPGERPSTGTPDSTGTPSMSAREQRGQLNWSGTGRMEGFEVGSMYGGDEKARNSVKNTFGRIASRYVAKPSSIDAIINDPDFKKFFPNAKKVGFDKIDFGGVMSDFETGTPVGVVDVGAGFDPESDTGRGWWWGYEDGGSTSTGAKSGASSVGIKTPSSGSDQTPSPGMPERGTPQTFTSRVPGVSVLTPEEIWSVPERQSPFASGATLGSMARRYR